MFDSAHEQAARLIRRVLAATITFVPIRHFFLYPDG
jgi:hypothetical protein